MNKRKAIYLITIALIAVVFGVYRTVTNSPQSVVQDDIKPSVLLGGFESMKSFSSIEPQLTSQGLQWTTIEDSRLPIDDGRPKFENKTIEVEGFRHANSVGTLRLEFFNDRLMATVFFPADMSSYEVAVEKELRIQIGDGPTILERATLIIKGEDARGRKFIKWSDTRLTEEQAKWIKRYSHRIKMGADSVLS